MNRRRRRLGFTLIELLVTMSIIVILASAGTYMYSTVKSKARDVKRKQDIKALQTALFLYGRSHSNIYPECYYSPVISNLATDFLTKSCQLWDKNFGYNQTTFTNSIGPYINKIPYDPLQTSTLEVSSLGTGYRYYGTNITQDNYSCGILSTCNNFGITACLENINDQEQDSVNVCPNGTVSYTLHAPN